MKVTVLASGSKGNATLIETKDANILIDAGLPLSNLEKRLNKKMPNIDILLITHTHIDHIKGINSILKKYKPKIYTISEELTKKIPLIYEVNYNKSIIMKNITIETFELSHDVPCMGIYIKNNDKELVYITDTGYIKETIINKYKNKDIYILESNYDEEMLKNGPYPFNLQQRIRGSKGHLSNSESTRYQKQLLGLKTKYLCLAHLSEENNTPEIAKAEAEKNKKNKTNLIICSQKEVVTINI